jgi:hypothetical protein
MKNLIVAVAIAMTSATPVFASDGGTDPRAEKKFSQQFAGAQHVKWTRLEDGYLRVTFVLNGIGAETYFDKDAELLGTVRNLFYSQLPLAVLQSVENKFGEITVIETKEVTNADGTSYRLIFEQKNKKYTVRLNSLGEIVDIQKKRI